MYSGSIWCWRLTQAQEIQCLWQPVTVNCRSNNNSNSNPPNHGDSVDAPLQTAQPLAATSCLTLVVNAMICHHLFTMHLALSKTLAQLNGWNIQFTILPPTHNWQRMTWSRKLPSLFTERPYFQDFFKLMILNPPWAIRTDIADAPIVMIEAIVTVVIAIKIIDMNGNLPCHEVTTILLAFVTLWIPRSALVVCLYLPMTKCSSRSSSSEQTLTSFCSRTLQTIPITQYMTHFHYNMILINTQASNHALVKCLQHMHQNLLELQITPTQQQQTSTAFGLTKNLMTIPK